MPFSGAGHSGDQIYCALGAKPWPGGWTSLQMMLVTRGLEERFVVLPVFITLRYSSPIVYSELTYEGSCQLLYAVREAYEAHLT